MNYITITPAISAAITLYGYMLDKTTNVFVSGHDLSLTQLTAVDHFSNSNRVSAICPSFTGSEIYTYRVIDPNRLSAFFYNITGTGEMDVIFYNRAGYTKLSDELYLLNFV